MLLKKKMYIPLHVHTASGSIGDSILKISDYVNRGKHLGLTHLGISNHGSMIDMYDFYEECCKANIVPIIGCEVYVTDDRLSNNKKYNHLVLIAKNEVGLKNLLHITTDAQLNGFYYKPRTDYSVLKDHGKGLIALSACVAGKIPEMIYSLKDETSDEVIEKVYNSLIAEINFFKKHFDDFYLELQPGDFEQQQFVNEMLVSLAEDTLTSLVVTNDVHYLNAEDWVAHDIHVKMARSKKIDDPCVYPDQCYYFQTHKEVQSSFPTLNQEVVKTAINNTIVIAESCSLSLKRDELFMPQFKVPFPYAEDAYLAHIVCKRLQQIEEHLSDHTRYYERMVYELEVIKELQFSGYFLTVRDFVQYAKDNHIPVGPGRGSVCGSLVAFLCGITEVDPIKYDLLFERFLSIHRKGSIPDVDLDFSAEKRQFMFEYAVRKYGTERCALVSSFTMRKAKTALRDTARVLKIDSEIADEAAKLIPEVYYDEEGEKSTDLSIEDSLKIVPRLAELRDNYPKWFEMAMKLEDLPKSTSIHPAGTLVSPVNLIDYIPLIKPNTPIINATALNLNAAEKAKFVKFDFLSLATLAVIDQTENDVDYHFDFVQNEYDDEGVWDLIGSKFTTNLFQISSKTYRERMHRLKPKTIKQLAACLALVRGPCISSRADEAYMQILEGKKAVEKLHEFYDKATESTLGILLYQEQLMQIAVNFGFSLEEGFKLMKAVAKKKIDLIKSYEEQFRMYADLNEVPIAIQDRIWQIIVDAGLYCFNESHAVAYAMLCYQSAYLKYYFPLEYMKNALTNAFLRGESTEETVQECRRLRIPFLPLDVNISSWEFVLEEDSIRIGMCAIKSFGETAARAVINNRPFENLSDFLDRVPKKDCSKRAIIPAIFVGLYSSFNEDRLAVYHDFCAYRKEEPLKLIKLQGNNDTFKVTDSYESIEVLIMTTAMISSSVNQLEPIGFDNLSIGTNFATEGFIRKVKKHKDKNGNEMAFLTIETGDGHIECVMFHEGYSNYKTLCKKNMRCVIFGKKNKESSCIISKLQKVV